MLGVTIRMNASTDAVSTEDGTTFDRSQMTGADKRKLRRLIRSAYEIKQENAIGTARP